MQQQWTTDSGILIISDLHAGRLGRKNSERAGAALSAMVQHANDRGIGKLMVNGDVFDERVPGHLAEDAMRLLRAALGEFAAGWQNIRFARGNHDILATENHAIRERLGGSCAVETHPIVFAEETGIVITHGDTLESGSAREEILRLARGNNATIRGLCGSPSLKRDIAALQRRYAVIARAANILAHVGIPVETLWERSRSIAHTLRIGAVRRLHRTEGARHDERTLRERCARFLDLRNFQVLAELSAGLGGWGAVVSHTHIPLLEKRRVRHAGNGRETVQIVGNTGSFVSRAGFPVTCIEACFPTMTLWQFHQATGELRPWKTLSLTAREQAQYLEHSNGIRAAP